MSQEHYPIPDEHQPLIQGALRFIEVVRGLPEVDDAGRAILGELEGVLRALPAIPPPDVALDLSVTLEPDELRSKATLVRIWGVAVYQQTVEIWSVYTDWAKPEDHGKFPFELEWVLEPRGVTSPEGAERRASWIRETSDLATFAPAPPDRVRTVELSR
jgi:hypothetical protein